MKHFLLFLTAFAFAGILYAQSPVDAEKGVTYGEGTTADGAISVETLDKKLSAKGYSGKIQGKVTEVCLEKGCWMKLERSNGEKVMVKFKDYGFFMPKNIVGKEVVVEGDAAVKEVSVKQLRHYAKDAGKTPAEVKKIKSPKKELSIVASGVLVL